MIRLSLPSSIGWLAGWLDGWMGMLPGLMDAALNFAIVPRVSFATLILETHMPPTSQLRRLSSFGGAISILPQQII